MWKPLIYATALGIALAGPAFAQSSQGAGSESKAPEKSGDAGRILPEQQPNELLVSEELIGKQVVNPEGKSLGTVQDLVLDSEGKLSGIVLSSGGFLGFGAKPVGISWSEITDAMGADVLTLDLSPEQVAKAPEFKTKADKQAEREARKAREQQQQQQLPATAE